MRTEYITSDNVEIDPSGTISIAIVIEHCAIAYVTCVQALGSNRIF